MKALLLNGSPNEKGNTYKILTEIAKKIEEEGIETEIFWIGKEAVHGCTACYSCKKNDSPRCVINTDVVNSFVDKAEEADGYIFASPVYYASPNGSLMALMNRAFFASDSVFHGKPGGVAAIARRAGTISAYDVMAKYLPDNGMPVAPSQYWPVAFGMSDGEVIQDDEGMQIMRMLGKNLAWLMKCIDAGKKAGLEVPQLEDRKIYTNFIRKDMKVKE